MKRILAILAAVFLTACAGVPAPAGPNSVLLGVHKTLNTFEEQVGLAAFAGRLNPDKADALLDQSGKVRSQLVQGRALLRACGGKLPCQPYEDTLRGINEQLIELECRRRQQEAGKPEDVCKLPPKKVTP